MADFSIINTRLATGAAISTDDDVQQLVNTGVSAVIDARGEYDDAPLFANHPALLYLWNPTPDDGQPKPPEYWAKSLAFALPFLAQPHGKLYCHCAAGVNRGPSTAACVMMALGWTKDQAEQAIRAARPQVGLAYLNDAAQAVTSLGYA